MVTENEAAVAELADANQLREPATGRFVAGHAPHPGAGRPRKGETIAEKLAKADAKVARKALRARDKRLELLNQVGQKAYENWLAYTVGLPKQAFVFETQDDPLLAYYQRRAERQALAASSERVYIVEGESRTLPATDQASDTDNQDV